MRRTVGGTSWASLLLGCVIVWPVSGQERAPYVWAATGKLITPRANACAVSLADGRVLVAGGDGADGPLASAEWYGDDAVFHQAAPMARARSHAACAALPDGRVLVDGGQSLGDPGPGAEIYDPAADQWQAAANEPLQRWGQTASVLSDGRVLLAGGESDAGATAALEVFHPVTNSFELLSSTLTTPRALHAAAVLQDDRVLIVGGSDGRSYLTTADLVDLETGEVKPLPELAKARAQHSLTTLLDGTVLVAGGINGDGDMSSSLLYLPGETRFVDGPALNLARSGHAALRIPGNGNVLLIGGSSNGEVTGTTEAYDFVLGQFVPAGPLTLARLGLAAAALGDQGVVLAVGGATSQGPVAACGTLPSPTLTATKLVYLATESATLNGAHYGSQESVVFTVQRTDLNGAVSSISIPSLITTSTGTFQTTIASQSAGNSVIVSARGVHTNLTAATSYIVGAATTTTLSITPASGAISAQPVTLSVQVHPASIAGALRGTVSFFDSSTLLGSIFDGKDGTMAVDANQNGSGTFVFSPGGGARSIRAEFSSKGFYHGSSSTQSYLVTKRDPAVNVTASPDTPRLGAPITLTAVVTSSGGIPLVRPGGTIAWAEVTAQGTIPLGVTALTAVSGFAGLTNVSASLLVSTGTTSGTRLFKATYNGDDNYLARNDGINVTVQRSLTSLSTLSLQFGSTRIPLANSGLSTAFPNLFQTTLTFTKVNGAVPTGKAFLRSDSLTIVSRDVSLFMVPGAQTASILLPFTFTGPGPLNLRIDYEGDAEFEPASTPVVPITVERQVPRLQLTHPTSVGPSDPDVRIALQADFESFASNVGFTPTGTVQVFRNNETTPVATGTLAAVSGTSGDNDVAFPLPRPPSSGTITYRIAYSGDNIYQPLTVTTGPIFNGPANSPTMILTYHPILDSQPDFEMTVTVKNSATSPPTLEGGVVQAFRNDATTAEDTEVLASGKCVFHLARASGSGSDTFRFVFTGSAPTVQGMTPPIH